MSTMYEDFLEMVKNDSGHPEQEKAIEFYKKNFKVSRERQFELIAHSSVAIQTLMENKSPDLFEPVAELARQCVTKEETVIAIYNFGRAVGVFFDSPSMPEEAGAGIKKEENGEDKD